MSLFVPAMVSCMKPSGPFLTTQCVAKCPSDEYVLNCTWTVLNCAWTDNCVSEQCPDGWTYKHETGYMINNRDCCRCGHESVELKVCRKDCPCWNRTTRGSAMRGNEWKCKDEFFDTEMFFGTNDITRDVAADVLRRFP